MSEAAAGPRWMTVAEVAARLRIAESTLRVWTREGRGPEGAKKAGRRIIYPEAAVEAYEASLPAPAEQESA